MNYLNSTVFKSKKSSLIIAKTLILINYSKFRFYFPAALDEIECMNALCSSKGNGGIKHSIVITINLICGLTSCKMSSFSDPAQCSKQNHHRMTRIKETQAQKCQSHNNNVINYEHLLICTATGGNDMR